MDRMAAPRPRRDGPAPARRVELDGIRGIAVLAVLAYHGGFAWAEGGFLGVDLFFALSGYLITTVLVREWRARGGIDFGRFWAHRVRRLAPALLLLVAAVVVYGAVVAPASEIGRLRGDSLATLAGVQNWHHVLTRPITTSPLTPMWSLAVELQWYLVWPPVLLVALRLTHGDLRRVALGTAAGAMVSAVWAVTLFHRGSGHSRVYLGTDARAMTLLAGATLGLVLADRPAASWARPRALDAVGAAGFVVWLLAVGLVDPRTDALYRGGSVVVTLACVAIVATAAASGRGALSALLRSSPLVALGLISYELYLFQWLVVEWLTPDRTGLGHWPGFLLQATVSIAAAAVAYRFVEVPVRERRWPPPVERALLGGSVVVVLAGVLLVLS